MLYSGAQKLQSRAVISLGGLAEGFCFHAQLAEFFSLHHRSEALFGLAGWWADAACHPCHVHAPKQATAWLLGCEGGGEP